MKTIDKRVCAQIEGPFVLFLIGARINRLWKPHKWIPFIGTMPKMLKELAAQPDLGLLHAESYIALPSVVVLQYWRSFDALEAYARNRAREHQPAWAWFNKALGSNGDIGIWHETYQIQPGTYESVYNNMPPFGLGVAGTLVDAVGARQEARRRMKAAAAA